MRIYGITGTNGKTTVTWVLAEFLKAAYITTVEVNTLKRRFYTGYTTPPLKMLEEIYAEMEEAGAKDCVMEVSSHAIAQNRVGFGTVTKFAGGAFTNISEDHLDYHKTMEEYFRVKLEFARRIADGVDARPSAGRGDLPPFVVCLDGEGSERMLAEVGRMPLNVLPVTLAAPRFDLSGLKLVGDFNKSNVLVAATLAEAVGVPKAEIERVIPQLRPRWGRLEKIANSCCPADVYVDFAHTPDGIAKVLAAARGFTSGRVWIVFGAGGDRDPAKRSLMGEAAAQGADVVIVTSDNPRSESPEAIIAAVMSGVCGAGGTRRAAETLAVPDRREAISYAMGHASAGDTVLVCGKGHETTQEIAGVKYPFDDREIVRNWRGAAEF